MNSEISKPSKHHVLILNLTDKIDLPTGEKSIPLSNLSIYNTLKNMKKPDSNNEFKISAPTWNDKFELPDESYSISDIRDFWAYQKKHGEKIGNPLIRIYVNNIENRITFKIKTGYYPELLTPKNNEMTWKYWKQDN